MSERVSPQAHLSLEDQLIFQMHQKTYEHARSFVEDKTVLDIGSGEGYGTDYLKEYVKEIIGLDVSEEAIRTAQSKYTANNLTFKKYDGTTLPFEDNTFDCIVSFQVIEHLTNPVSFLKEIVRVLKPAGQLILSTPNARIRRLFFQNPWNRFHIQEYTTEDLSKLLRKDFKNIEFWGLTLLEPYLSLEKKRTNRNKWILWPFSIKIWPYSVRRFFLSLLARLQSIVQNSNKNTETLKDVALVTKTGVEIAPSFILVAEKSHD